MIVMHMSSICSLCKDERCPWPILQHGTRSLPLLTGHVSLVQPQGISGACRCTECCRTQLGIRAH